MRTEPVIEKIQLPLQARIDSRSAALSNGIAHDEEADAETEGMEPKARTPSISARTGAQERPEGEAPRRKRHEDGTPSNRQKPGHGVNQLPEDDVLSGEFRARNHVARRNQSPE